MSEMPGRGISVKLLKSITSFRIETSPWKTPRRTLDRLLWLRSMSNRVGIFPKVEDSSTESELFRKLRWRRERRVTKTDLSKVVWSLTQFYSVDSSQSRIGVKSGFSTNAQSRFASVVVDSVLGPPCLARGTLDGVLPSQ